jgi:hypothetical protein
VTTTDPPEFCAICHREILAGEWATADRPAVEAEWAIDLEDGTTAHVRCMPARGAQMALRLEAA